VRLLRRVTTALLILTTMIIATATVPFVTKDRLVAPGLRW
jgi:hypothetical protein